MKTIRETYGGGNLASLNRSPFEQQHAGTSALRSRLFPRAERRPSVRLVIFKKFEPDLRVALPGAVGATFGPIRQAKNHHFWHFNGRAEVHPCSSQRNVENDATQYGLASGYLAPLDHADPAR
jgi:hypothetical protein